MPNILHKLASDGARASRKKGPKKLQDSQKKILNRATIRLAANFLPKGCVGADPRRPQAPGLQNMVFDVPSRQDSLKFREACLHSVAAGRSRYDNFCGARLIEMCEI